ncbi:MAG: sugar phosphate isomerase/epimerase [Verrucomicrobia bacterium]|nr:sugar phosphate isomerase/epimerase [Verrucomicrobiota bacterium]
MDIGLSTHWNAYRHTDGRALVDEIAALGFTSIELGYDTRLDLLPGIEAAVEAGAIQVHSLHAICPVPMGAPRGHPEIYTMASTEKREREQAVVYLQKTLDLAAALRAKAVVVHAGNVSMTRMSRELVDLARNGQQFTARYENLKFKLQEKREKKSRKQFGYLAECLAQIMPRLETNRVALGLELLPSWESFPTEMELEYLLSQFPTRWFGAWIDIGHVQIRENLGFINLDRWMEKLGPRVVGMHLHDVVPPTTDHVMPPAGAVHFDRFEALAQRDIPKVIEPAPRTPEIEIQKAHQHLLSCWKLTTTNQEQHDG